MDDRSALGKYGEDLAVRSLQKVRYRVLERNYRCKLGEIDLIARHKNTLVFVEVKTRTSAEFGSPQSAVTPRKQRQLIRTALFYLQEHRLFDQAARFDVVAVELTGEQERVSIIRNAFELTS